MSIPENIERNNSRMLEEIEKENRISVYKITDTAKLPTKSDGDMAYDVYADEDCFVEQGKITVVKTGIKLAPPKDFHYSVRDRSGLAAKHGLHILAGQIDNSYRGELLICITKLKHEWKETEFDDHTLCEIVKYEIKKGDKIAQIKLEEDTTFPVVEVQSEEDLGSTNRGENGFGSSGR
jgi:dUTP pyrophosphatase